ncbi:X-Pro dipeptidyl-peptidase [Devosia pacifica]|uniref:X-Pro dipeptidyl-peptidase n=1 Tax=Devosia pacifica TaxID=1335967 RepID=A0A918VRS6_9HYPH|nr:CocE/NonD family hydrolase [Devosia pacifica]GHA17524.1 X-Pro dipeptidyl-peptidase [Devosia pacifica]
MSIGSLFIAQLYQLPPRRHAVGKSLSLRVVMDDGVELLTDHYAPKTAGPHPTLLMRLPYGRRGFAPVAEVYAERGYNVVLQACRGTEESGGRFDPLVNERKDGLATLEWIKAQLWFDGRIGLTGPSYLGYAQWAICDALPATSAMATKVTSSEFQSVVFPSGAFHLGLWLSWMQVIEGLRGNPLKMTGRMFSGTVERLTHKAAMHLPLVEGDEIVTGHRVPFWREWFENAIGNDEFWREMDHRHRLSETTPPNHFVSGWYDFMIDQLLRDYTTLVGFGHRPHLTIGPWTHVSGELQAESLRQTLHWMNAKLLEDPSGLREHPVRIYVTGTETWHEFESFPPGAFSATQFYLNEEEKLTEQAPTIDAATDTYTYDPADPTPNIGGAMFAFKGAGPADNAAREARNDVLCFSTEPLAQPVTIIGQSDVVLFASAELEHTDFFVRLCDVDPQGKSLNITDGLLRVTPNTPRQTDGTWRLEFTLHATAHCFLRGHRIRVQVSSGAHPRYARNLGTGEPLGTTTTLLTNAVTVHRDAEHPSSIMLRCYEL